MSSAKVHLLWLDDCQTPKILRRCWCWIVFLGEHADMHRICCLTIWWTATWRHWWAYWRLSLSLSHIAGILRDFMKGHMFSTLACILKTMFSKSDDRWWEKRKTQHTRIAAGTLLRRREERTHINQDQGSFDSYKFREECRDKSKRSWVYI